MNLLFIPCLYSHIPWLLPRPLSLVPLPSSLGCSIRILIPPDKINHRL